MDRVAFIRNTLRDFVSHFAFGVVDNNIIVRHQKSICNLTLCTERLAGAGSAEDQTVGVFQLLSVYHDIQERVWCQSGTVPKESGRIY